mgnify:CR=1 FL=1
MNWTQPVCSYCYDKREPGRTPTRLRGADAETCCDCGKQTAEGIYFRVDPRTVKHPAP